MIVKWLTNNIIPIWLKGKPKINNNNPSRIHYWPCICFEMLPHRLFINTAMWLHFNKALLWTDMPHTSHFLPVVHGHKCNVHTTRTLMMQCQQDTPTAFYIAIWPYQLHYHHSILLMLSIWCGFMFEYTVPSYKDHDRITTSMGGLAGVLECILRETSLWYKYLVFYIFPNKENALEKWSFIKWLIVCCVAIGTIRI